jgi:hypothetical protein
MQILDPDSTKRHQFEGFLPADDVLSQLKLGLARSAFARQQWKEAESRYEDVVKTLPDSNAAAAMCPLCGKPQKLSRRVIPIAPGQRRLRSGRSDAMNRLQLTASFASQSEGDADEPGGVVATNR